MGKRYSMTIDQLRHRPTPAPYVLRAAVDLSISPELVPLAMAKAVQRMTQNLVNLDCDMATLTVRTGPMNERPNTLQVIVTAVPQ